jgi:threonylcarbamoyladenosine tRNA methylthiotransferase MtaB
MKRRHLRDDAIRFCADLRGRRPDIVFGADLIAGFPTETEAMFENTMRLVEECGLTWLHVFPYSARRGTPAAKMPQVPKAARVERAARLRTRGGERAVAWAAGRIGGTERVVVETPRTARSDGFAEVLLPRDHAPGAMTATAIVAADGPKLIAA